MSGEKLTKTQWAWLRKLAAADTQGRDLFPPPNYVMTGKLDAAGVAEIVPAHPDLGPHRWPWSNYKLRITPAGREALSKAVDVSGLDSSSRNHTTTGGASKCRPGEAEGGAA